MPLSKNLNSYSLKSSLVATWVALAGTSFAAMDCASAEVKAAAKAVAEMVKVVRAAAARAVNFLPVNFNIVVSSFILRSVLICFGVFPYLVFIIAAKD